MKTRVYCRGLVGMAGVGKVFATDRFQDTLPAESSCRQSWFGWQVCGDVAVRPCCPCYGTLHTTKMSISLIPKNFCTDMVWLQGIVAHLVFWGGVVPDLFQKTMAGLNMCGYQRAAW